MRGKSHIALGCYLLNRYLPELPRRYRKAFLIGCIEPDRNPTTYLKGSLRGQWLRGHNYLNSKRFMERISLRLEQKKSLKLFDYYTLGKLIHYTADAFTFAHNEQFPENLTDHRKYEAQLQEHFLQFIQDSPQVPVRLAESVMDGIRSCHLEYTSVDTDFRRDSRFALQACCCVLAVLLTPRII